MQHRTRRPATPAPAPLAQAVHQQLTGKSIGAPAEQKGFSLIEVMLGVAVATLVAGGTYGVYRHLDTKKQIRTEQAHVQDLARDVSSAYASLGRYPTTLRTAAIGDSLVPAEMVSGTQLRNSWGSAVDLVPTTIDGRANAGMEIVYANVPKRACALFASSAGAGMFDVEINGDSVMSGEGGVDRLATGTACAPDAGSQVVFTYYSGATGLSVTAPASLCTSDPTNPLCVAETAPPPSTPTTTPPTSTPPPTPTGTPPPPFTPPPVAPPPVTPPAPPPVPPTTPPAAPPPSAPPTFCPPVAAATAPKAARWCTHWVGDAGSVAWQDTVCEDGTDGRDDRTFNCPAGQLITTAGTSQYDPSGPQRRALRETHHYECTDPWNDDPATFADVWESDPSVSTNWSGWSPAYTCAPACVAPPATTQTQATTPQTRTLGCPADYYGTIDQSRPRSQDRTVTYTCPTPVGAYTTTYGAWGTPYATPPGTWATTSNTCTSCPTLAPQGQIQWVPVDPGCPSGQVGEKHWEKQQQRTRTRDYVCPAGTTTLPGITYGTWSAWADTGATRNVVNTCAPTTAPPPWCTPGSLMTYGDGLFGIGDEAPTIVCDAAHEGKFMFVGQTGYSTPGWRSFMYQCKSGSFTRVLEGVAPWTTVSLTAPGLSGNYDPKTTLPDPYKSAYDSIWAEGCGWPYGQCMKSAEDAWIAEWVCYTPPPPAPTCAPAATISVTEKAFTAAPYPTGAPAGLGGKGDFTGERGSRNTTSGPNWAGVHWPFGALGDASGGAPTAYGRASWTATYDGQTLSGEVSCWDPNHYTSGPDAPDHVPGTSSYCSKSVSTPIGPNGAKVAVSVAVSVDCVSSTECNTEFEAEARISPALAICP